jgi:myotubularin-related protein 1/2
MIYCSAALGIELNNASLVFNILTPALCYQYKNNCCIWRSSQTSEGLTQQRNLADEIVLKKIIDFSRKLIIYDARPYLNAMVNRVKGAGYEIIENYPDTELKFCDIENIHVVRDSFNKLVALVNNPGVGENKQFLTSLEQTGWLNIIHQIIKSAIDISKSIKNSNTVLVHCSDGWDRTSQLTSLAQLLLDPFYRTIKGFIILVEKEWLSFGHQFGLRNGFHVKKTSEDQFSPIFLQWLDCVHQILVLHKNVFEFNLSFLNFIGQHVYSGLYGTFLYNCEKVFKQ